MGKAKQRTDSFIVATGMAIRELRQKASINQEDLANLAGVDRSYMGSVERGSYNLSLKNLTKIAGALEKTPSQILKVAESYWTGKLEAEAE